MQNGNEYTHLVTIYIWLREKYDIDGLVKDYSNSGPLAMELLVLHQAIDMI